MPRFLRYYEPSTVDLKSLAVVKDYVTSSGVVTPSDAAWAREVLAPESALDKLRTRIASRAASLGTLALFVIGLFFFMQVLEIAGNFALGLAAMATPLFLAPGIAYVALISRGNFSLHTIISPENVVFRRAIAVIAVLSSAVQFVFVIIQITVFCDPTNPLFLASSAYQQLCSTQRVVAISAAVLSGIYLVALFAAAIVDLVLTRAESAYTNKFRELISHRVHDVSASSAYTSKVAAPETRRDGILLGLAIYAASRNADILRNANFDGKRVIPFYIPFVDDVLYGTMNPSATRATTALAAPMATPASLSLGSGAGTRSGPPFRLPVTGFGSPKDQE